MQQPTVPPTRFKLTLRALSWLCAAAAAAAAACVAAKGALGQGSCRYTGLPSEGGQGAPP